MSSTPETILFMGFEVFEHDFVTSIESGEETCPQGHVRTGQDPFCSKDGGRFMKQRTLEFTERFKKLAEFQNWEIEGRQLWEFTGYRGQDADGAVVVLNEPFIHLTPRGHDRGDWRMFIGRPISQMDANHNRWRRMPLDIVLKALEQLETLRVQLDMNDLDRDIQLYHTVGWR